MEKGHYIGMAIGGALLLAGYLWLKKKDTGQLAQDAAAGVAGALVDAASGAATGTVLGIGDAIGVPRTNMSQCEQDKAAGRTYDASFSCPAGDFIGYLLTPTSSSPAPADPAPQVSTPDLMQDPTLVNVWGPM